MYIMYLNIQVQLPYKSNDIYWLAIIYLFFKMSLKVLKFHIVDKGDG